MSLWIKVVGEQLLVSINESSSIEDETHFLMLSAHLTQNFLWRYQGLLTLIWDKKTDEKFLSGSINAHMLQKINTGEGWETEGTFIHCWWKSKLIQPLWKTV